MTARFAAETAVLVAVDLLSALEPAAFWAPLPEFPAGLDSAVAADFAAPDEDFAVPDEDFDVPVEDFDVPVEDFAVPSGSAMPGKPSAIVRIAIAIEVLETDFFMVR